MVQGKCGACGKLIMTSLAYKCEKCGHYFNVANCLVDEVRSLYLAGISVMSARCLRFSETGSIGVNPSDAAKMESLGYSRLSASKLDLTSETESFFAPKTSMPINSLPEKFEIWEKTHSVLNQKANENVSEKDDYNVTSVTLLPEECSFDVVGMKLSLGMMDEHDSTFDLNYEGVYSSDLVAAVAETMKEVGGSWFL